MKISNLTYISCSTIPSALANSVHVMKMCNSFASKGLSVNLVCKQSENWNGETDALESYDCKNHFTISAFPNRKKGLLGSLSYILFATKQVFRTHGVVYSRYFYPLLPLLFLHKPFVLEFHADINSLTRFIVKILIRRKECKQLVFISQSLQELFVNKYHADLSKCIVLADACDVSDAIECNTKKSVGYVGHLYKGRGIELLIEVAKRLPEYKFHLIGGKEPELSYYRSISPDNMIYYGSVKHSELANYYSKFGIALAPYQKKVYSADAEKSAETSKYCSPMKLFEYMAYKKAIICSDLPVFHEVGENGQELIYQECNDVDGWVDSIIQLTNNDQLQRTIVENAYSKFLANYTWGSRVDKIIKFIEG